MTTTELARLLNLPAGRELDAAVAVRIMGFRYCKSVNETHHYESVLYEPEEAAKFLSSAVSTEPTGRPLIADNRVPCFSIDIDDAMQALDHWHGDYEIRRQNGQFKVTLYEPSMQYDLWGRELPLTICRVLLKGTKCRSLPKRKSRR